MSQCLADWWSEVRIERAIPLVLCLCVAGCGDLFGPGGYRFEIVTETEYRLEVLPHERLALTVSYSILNSGGEPVYVRANCQGAVHADVRQWNGDGWSAPEGLQNPFVPGCGGEDIEVRRTEVYQFTLPLDGPQPATPELLNGTYQVLMTKVFDSEGELLPEEDRMSRSFTIRMP